MKGAERHHLTNIDAETRTATCSVCGPTAIHYRASGRNSECQYVRLRNRGTGSPEAKRRHRLAGYGLTVSGYDELLVLQGGRCAICFTLPPDLGPVLHVDHCHKSGRVRGLLCHNCNTGIGSLREDPDILRSAISYLAGAPGLAGAGRVALRAQGG